MSGGWAGHERPLPSNWTAIRAQVHRRSGRKCEVKVPAPRGRVGLWKCGRYADGGVDHIDRHGPHELWNLQDTCKAHHDRKTQQEAQEAKQVIRDKGKRPPERHPGEIRRTT